MSSLRWIRSGLFGACASVFFLLVGCSGDEPRGGPSALTVTTEHVEMQKVPLTIETVGRSEGSKEVEIRARVSGILERQVYSEGERVRAGQRLFLIERSPFEIALAHARAALAEAQAHQQQAQRNAERLTMLAEKNAVSRRSADDALSELKSAEAALLRAEADVREAQLNLSYTEVLAPIAGITGRALRSEGSLVNANTESSLLTTLIQTDPMWVRFALSESEYAALRGAEGSSRDALTVALLDRDGEPRATQGKVNFAASTIDPALGTVQLRAEFANPDLAMLPGEYVRVRLQGGMRAAITVPQKAVFQTPQGPAVWVVSSEGKAQQRKVKTGGWVGAHWEIDGGLHEGDEVIIDNLLKLRPELPVQPRSATARSKEPNGSRDAKASRGSTSSQRAG